MPSTRNAPTTGWRSTFKYFDRNQNGSISARELHKAFLSLNQEYTQEDVNNMLAAHGIDKNAELSFEQYANVVRANFADISTVTRSELNSIYAGVDIDLSGYLTAAELGHFMTKMNIDLHDKELSEMISMYDLNGDNQLPVSEFENILKTMGYAVVEDTPKAVSAKNAMKQEKMQTRIYPPSGKKLDLSKVRGDALEALQLFDLQNTGVLDLDDLKQAAEMLKSYLMRVVHNPDNDPALHWDPNRERRGLGKYIYKANHMAIIVSDVARSARFYSNVLGLQQIRRPNFDKHGAWFTIGNIELHLIKGRPLVHSGDDLIVNHISIETYEIDDIPKTLREIGIPFRQNVSVPKGEDGGNGGGTNTAHDNDKIVRQYFFRDPDGYYIEVCNCMELTEYCLGAKDTLDGYDESVKPLSATDAAVTVNLMQKWAMQGRVGVKGRDALSQKVKETDGSISAIAALLGCTPAQTVDIDMVENMQTRRTVYGDICQNYSEAEVSQILLASGNDAHLADEIMHQKAVFDGTRTFQPPSFYENGEDFTTPVAFSVPVPYKSPDYTEGADY